MTEEDCIVGILWHVDVIKYSYPGDQLKKSWKLVGIGVYVVEGLVGNLMERGHWEEKSPKWNDNIKTVFQDIDYSVDWIDLAQDRKKWWDRVNEMSGCIKGAELLVWLRRCEILKKESAVWS